MISRATICLYRLRHTSVAAAAPAMTSRVAICLCCLRHTAVAAAAYSGRSGGPGYDIPCSPSQCSSSHCYRAKPFVRRYSGDDGTALSPQQQPAPRPLSSFVRDQRYNGGHSAAPPQQPAPRPFSSFVRDQRYNGGHSTAPQQQPRTRPLSSFGWDQRYACPSRPPVNAGLANNIAQGQAQRDGSVDDRAEQQRPTTDIDFMVDLFPRCPDPRRQPHRWHEGDSLYRHAASDGFNHLAGPSHRQPSLSRTRPLSSCCCCFSHSAHWLLARKKTTLHGGQSRSWSAEQGKRKEKEKPGSVPPPLPPPPALPVRRKKNKTKKKHAAHPHV